MIKWTREELEEQGYKIENAEITSVDLSMRDHGVLTLSIAIDSKVWACVYGGYILGKGYVGCEDEYFDGSAAGMESIIRIMDVVGCDSFNKMNGKIIRVATKGWGSSVKIIGNALEEKWFDIDSFFKQYRPKGGN